MKLRVIRAGAVFGSRLDDNARGGDLVRYRFKKVYVQH